MLFSSADAFLVLFPFVLVFLSFICNRKQNTEKTMSISRSSNERIRNSNNWKKQKTIQRASDGRPNCSRTKSKLIFTWPEFNVIRFVDNLIKSLNCTLVVNGIRQPNELEVEERKNYVKKIQSNLMITKETKNERDERFFFLFFFPK